MTKQSVDRAIEGLFERLCLYLALSDDPRYAKLHEFLLEWIREGSS